MADTHNRWTEPENEIIRSSYPTMGPHKTVEELRRNHFIRSVGAVKMQAKALNVKRDRSTIDRENTWSNEELSIIRGVYPKGGEYATKLALDRAGYDRSLAAIKTRACMLGIKTTATRRRMQKGGKKTVVNVCLDEVLDAKIISFLRRKQNRSKYIRGLIERDMGKK